MKEVVITIPKDKTAVVINFLQDEVRLRNIQLIAGVNCSQLKTQVQKAFVGEVLHSLDKIGCGVVYGTISVSTIDTIKPVPRTDPVLAEKRIPNSSLLSFHWQTNNLSTEEIHAMISNNNNLDVNYITMMLIASSIAGVGLMSNNTVMIVASMLVSVLMGPILGITFGCVIRDFAMVNAGICNEFVGFLIALMVGVVIGLVYYCTNDPYEWPTEEMASRGTTEALILGTLYAFPSGIGVGISVSDGGINGLVGVAIAASLLPPIANCGMSVTYGLLSQNEELLEIGGFSLALFVINFIMIFITGYSMFKFIGMESFRRKSSTWKGLKKVTAEQIDDPSFHEAHLDALNTTTQGNKNDNDDNLYFIGRNHGLQFEEAVTSFFTTDSDKSKEKEHWKSGTSDTGGESSKSLLKNLWGVLGYTSGSSKKSTSDNASSYSELSQGADDKVNENNSNVSKKGNGIEAEEEEDFVNTIMKTSSIDSVQISSKKEILSNTDSIEEKTDSPGKDSTGPKTTSSSSIVNMLTSLGRGSSTTDNVATNNSTNMERDVIEILKERKWLYHLLTRFCKIHVRRHLLRRYVRKKLKENWWCIYWFKKIIKAYREHHFERYIKENNM